MKAIEIDVTDIESRGIIAELPNNCLLYTSDAADD